MGAGVGAFFSGLAQGAQTGIQLTQQQERLQLAKRDQELQEAAAKAAARKQDLEVADKLMNLFVPGEDPALTEYKLQVFTSVAGEDYLKTPQFAGLKKMIMKMNDDTRAAMRDSLAAILPDAEPGEISTLAKSFMSGNGEIISKVAKVVNDRKTASLKEREVSVEEEKLSLEKEQVKKLERLLGGLNGDASQPASTPASDAASPTPSVAPAPVAATPPAAAPDAGSAPAQQPAPDEFRAPSGVTTGPSAKLQLVQNMLKIGQSMLAAGNTKMANAISSQVRAQIATDPQLKTDLAKSDLLTPEQAAELGVSVGTTYGQAEGIVPRSPEEKAASVETAKVIAKSQAELKTPIDPNTSSFLRRMGADIPVTLTRGEAAKRGITPELRPTDIVTLGQAHAMTDSAGRTAANLIDIVQNRPEVLGAPGGLAAVINNFVAQGQGFINLTRQLGDPFKFFRDGNEVSEDTLKDATRYSSIFEELSISNAEVQSAFVSLAFNMAAAAGQSNRSVSDKDVEKFLREIGAGRNDPVVFASVLRKAVARSERASYDAFKAITGVYPKGASTPVLPIPKMDMKDLSYLKPQLLTVEELQAVTKRLDALEGSGE